MCKSSEKIREGDIGQVVEDIIDKNAKFEDDDTNPGFVMTDKKPSFEVYEKAVKEIVSLRETEKLLKSLNAYYKGYKNCRGLIGATASISWHPKNDKTYELLAYREKSRWGTERFVDDASVKDMDKRCNLTFDNYDYVNNHNRLVPNSPCPILYGVRGDSIGDLICASSMVKSEKVDSWLIFETNQATDDHLQRKMIGDIKPFESVISEGEITKNPRTIEGGHVIFTVSDSTGVVDCAAYEPTKEFRDVIRELQVDDAVEIYGGVREKPLTINLEKIKVEKIDKKMEKIENPVCPNCGKHMKSRGKNQGYKCKNCGIKSDKPVIEEKKRNLNLGFYEVPVCARRHLSKPLKRMNHKPF